MPISSHIPLIAAHGSSATANGPSPGLVSNGFGSVELLNQPTSTRQNSFLFDDTYLGVTDLGERICLSTPASLVSKSFQSYYRKGREGRAMHLNEILVAESVAALRIDKHVGFSVAATQPLHDSGGVAARLKVIKQSVPARAILRRGFLNSSMPMQPLLSPKVSTASSSSLVAKEDGVEGIPTLLGDCSTPNDDKAEDSLINGLIQSQSGQ